MTRAEFIPIWAYLVAGCGKNPNELTIEVYFDLLKDLSDSAVKAGVQMALAESQYPVLPPVGVIRKLSCEATQKPRLPVGEAWRLVLDAVHYYGYNRPQEAFQSLPSDIAHVAQCFGWQSLCESTETEVCRAQFTKMYESLGHYEMRKFIMPPTVRKISQGLAATFELPPDFQPAPAVAFPRLKKMDVPKSG